MERPEWTRVRSDNEHMRRRPNLEASSIKPIIQNKSYISLKLLDLNAKNCELETIKTKDSETKDAKQVRHKNNSKHFLKKLETAFSFSTVYDSK